MGRPTYRDRSVAPPQRAEPRPDEEKPQWMRTAEPVNDDATIVTTNTNGIRNGTGGA